MSQSTISTFQLFALFPDEETARQYLEDRREANRKANQLAARDGFTDGVGGEYRLEVYRYAN